VNPTYHTSLWDHFHRVLSKGRQLSDAPATLAWAIEANPQAHIDALVEAGVLERHRGVNRDVFVVIQPAPPDPYSAEQLSRREEAIRRLASDDLNMPPPPHEHDYRTRSIQPIGGFIREYVRCTDCDMTFTNVQEDWPKFTGEVPDPTPNA